jgi:hypothetical protein
MSAMGPGRRRRDLPHYDALQAGGSRADSSPEGVDRAGKGFDEAFAELHHALLGANEDRIRETVDRRIAERLAEFQVETGPCIHYHTHHHSWISRHIHRGGGFHWAWVIVGAIIGFLIMLFYLLNIGASVIDVLGGKPGTHITVLNSVDQLYYWLVMLFCGTVLGAGAGLLVSLFQHHDEGDED